MQVLLPKRLAQRLVKALQRADHQEIGGILLGEHVSPAQFRIQELTVQMQGGTPTTFVRVVEAIVIPLRRFFRQTRHHYTRFNYLGEWHSHPGLPLTPSQYDSESMWKIVEDPTVGANFAVLLIVQLDGAGQLVGGISVFLPGRQRYAGELIQEFR